MKVTEIYTRCSGGCLFSTLRCRYDGWADEDTQLVYSTKIRMRDSGFAPTVNDIKAQLKDKVSPKTLDCLVEITFPDPRMASECFMDYEQVDGMVRSSENLPKSQSR